jgi:hypothetical protein
MRRAAAHEMKVRCLTDNPEDFALETPFKDAFWHAPGMSMKTNTFVGLDVGQTYVVYAIMVLAGFPYYYVKDSKHPDSWCFAPSLCFEMLDDRPSRLWRCEIDHNRRKTPILLLAIREWVEEPRFFELLVDCREREVRLNVRSCRVYGVRIRLNCDILRSGGCGDQGHGDRSTRSNTSNAPMPAFAPVWAIIAGARRRVVTVSAPSISPNTNVWAR